MDSWVDAVGNVHGRLNGSDPTLPALFLGSHYDTVLDAGRLVWLGLCVVRSQYSTWYGSCSCHNISCRYDGPLGIITAIAAVKMAAASQLLQAGGTAAAALLAAGEGDDIAVSAADATGVLKRTVHIVAFADEEGVRFQSTFLGSRALVRDPWVCWDDGRTG